MRNILISTVASAILALTATASEGKIDRESFLATGQIYLASQLLSDDSFDIKLKVYRFGHASMMDRMLGKEPKDEDWRENIRISYDALICSTPQAVHKIKGMNVDIKSYVGDAAVVGMREAVKILKDDGAKYIFFEVKAKDEKNSGNIAMNMPFDQCFSSMITSRYDPKNALPTGWIGGKPSDGKDGSYVVPAMLRVKTAPNKQCSAGTDWSGLASMIAQVGFMALGVKGASSGNTNVANFSANASNAAASAGESSNHSNASTDVQSGENFAAEAALYVSGIKSIEYVKKHPRSQNETGYGVDLYVFPIEDVEKTLAKYMDMPYRSQIIDY